MRTLLLISSLCLILAGAARAGEADVVDAVARPEAGGTWRFDVTLRHDDTGWDHYADRWDVMAPDGTLLGSRVLLHPHVNEQPFTRSLGGVAVPAGITHVRLRGHDKVHELGGIELEIELKP